MAAKPSEKVVAGLQESLVDLIDLSLQAKQAHWNVYGSHFRSVHLQLDEVTDEVRLAADDVAERLVAIGGEPDGRAATVASSSQVDAISAGRLADDKVIRQFEERLQATADRIKGHLDGGLQALLELTDHLVVGQAADRKSTRLNSSHVKISYAVF